MLEKPVRIRDFQELIRRAYFEKDRRRGLYKTVLWLIEEVGELATAIRREDKKNIAEEIADVIAWVVSIANLLGIDVEQALIDKYGNPPQKHPDE